MMEDGYWKLKKRHNVEKIGVVGHLDLPGGRSPKKEELNIISSLLFMTCIL